MGSCQSKGVGIPNQTGKTFVVTGANSGLGFIVTKELCRAGGHVIVCARSEEKSLGACKALVKELGAAELSDTPSSGTTVLGAGKNGGALETGVVDLASLDSVKHFAKTVQDRPIHCLVNNAGVMNIPKRELSKDGFEMQLATNCLGTYALSVLLVPALRKSATASLKPRVVNVSSIRAAVCIPPADTSIPVDWKKDGGYDSDIVYNESKLCNLMINNKMATLCPDITCMGCHPGVCSTNLFRHKNGWAKIMMQSPETGAKSIIWSAVAPEKSHSEEATTTGGSETAAEFAKLNPVVSGKTYLGPAGWYGGPGELEMPKAATEDAQLDKYWAAMEAATNVKLA